MHYIPVQFRPDLMIPYYSLKMPALGKLSVTKLEVTNGWAHCKDDLPENFCDRVFIQCFNILDQYGIE